MTTGAGKPPVFPSEPFCEGFFRRIMDEVDKKLRAFQQGELDAMVMYRDLSERVFGEKDRDLLKSIAAQEGRHAAICRGLTCVNLDCKKGTSRAVSFLYAVLRKKATFRLLAFAEKKAGKKYEKFVEKYDINELSTVAEDEYGHAEKLLSAAKEEG